MEKARLLAAAACLLWVAVSDTSAQPALTTVVDLCESDDQIGAGTNLQTAIRIALTDRPDTAVTFACPLGAVIALHRDNYQIARDLTIDGGSNVILDLSARVLHPGSSLSPTFVVPQTTTFTLKNISAINGPSIEASGVRSSIIESEGALFLESVTISNSASPIMTRGGAIIRDARIVNNTGDAITVYGDAVVEGSVFASNSLVGLRVGGTISLDSSKFYNNGVGLAFPDGSVQRSLFQANKSVGIVVGPLRADAAARPTANVSVLDTRFDGNLGTGVHVTPSNWPKKIRFTKSAFTRNGVGGLVLVGQEGGPTDLSIFQTKFLGNISASGSAIYILDSDKQTRVEIKGAAFSENAASERGGAIFASGQGSLRILNSIFTKNTAGQAGAALFARGSPTPADLVMANSIVANHSLSDDGAILDVDWAALVNVTIANNQGRGLQFASRPSGQVILNTIISANSSGNCGGEVEGAFGVGNIQYGFADCPGVPVLDPALDAIFVPGPGSPARGGGNIEVCRAPPVNSVDLVYQERGEEGHCSSGAFERAPIRVATKLIKRQAVMKCPDGSPMYGNTPCPDSYHTCPNGEELPASVACSVRNEQRQVCQSYGQACRTGADCCNAIPCTGPIGAETRRCRYP